MHRFLRLQAAIPPVMVTYAIGLLVVVVLFASSTVRPVQAATSSTLNFQARLMTSPGAIVPDGTYNVEFKLYNAASSSGSSQGSCSGDAACLWTETRTGANQVRVVNGYLTANLGSVTALPNINWDQELWLTLNIGGTGGSPSWDGEMSPRLKLTAVPYAFTAGQLATANGSFRSVLSFVQPTANRTIQAPDESGTICIQSSTACGFVAGSAANFIQNQSATDQTATFRINGTGRANTSFMTPVLQPTADGTSALKIQSTDNTVTALVADTYNGRIAIGADTSPQERLDVIGNLQVRDATTATKSYRLRTSGSGLDFEGSGADLYLSIWSGAGYSGTQYNQIVFKANGSNMNFARGFNVSDSNAKVGLAGNVNPQYALDSSGDINTSTQYRIGGTVVCTSSGCTASATSAIQNQNSSDQTANFRISGTGRANTSLQAPLFDTATAGALAIGTTNATSINLNKATAVSGNLSQSGGTVSLAATGTLSLSATTTGSLTSTGALTLTGGAASTWSASAGGLTVLASGANTLALTTGTSGTVALGATSATTIAIGTGASVTRAISIGTAGTNTTIIGNTTSGTVAVRGDTSSSAIALTTGSGGKINLTAAGTGGIVGTIGSAGIVLQTTTDSNNALQIKSSGGSSIFNVNTATGTILLGALSVNYSSFDALVDAPFGSIYLGTSSSGSVIIGGSSTTTTFGGGLVDLGSAGTVQGAGLSSDCSGSYSKLLWSSSTKKFSCGTDRASFLAKKAADQTVNASTTYVNATDMAFTVGANETWIFEAHLNYNTASTPGIKFDVTAPTSSTCDLQKINVNGGVGGAKYTCAGGAKPDISMSGVSGFDANETVAGSVVTGANSGTVQLQFAQNTSNAANTVLYAGSWIVAYKVSGADVAEIYYAKDTSVEPGDVVAIDDSLQAGVKKTTTAYDGSAIGVVSTKPGLVLGEPTASGGKPVLLALNGRIPVKVTNENGLIKAGDYLTPSAKHPGYAMKATRAGYSIGQALAGFNEASGTVLMFGRLGYYPGASAGLQGSDTTMDSLNVTGDAHIKGSLSVKGPVSINSDDSRAFSVQDAMGNVSFGINNRDHNVYVGKPGGASRATLFILSRKTTKGDPRGTNGAIYYNDASATFRCFEDGTWKNCTNGSGMSYNTELGGAVAKLTKPQQDSVMITPLYIPGRIVVDELRAYVTDMPKNAKGDIGVYNAKGQLVLNGGKGSLSGDGLRKISPRQQGQGRIVEAGQYYVAITWDSDQGYITGVRLPYTGLLKYNGTLDGGGQVLAGKINLSSIAETATVPSLSVND
jgi:hypothetical protein